MSQQLRLNAARRVAWPSSRRVPWEAERDEWEASGRSDIGPSQTRTARGQTNTETRTTRVVDGLGWVGLGQDFSVFCGLCWVGSTTAKVLRI